MQFRAVGGDGNPWVHVQSLYLLLWLLIGDVVAIRACAVWGWSTWLGAVLLGGQRAAAWSQSLQNSSGKFGIPRLSMRFLSAGEQRWGWELLLQGPPRATPCSALLCDHLTWDRRGETLLLLTHILIYHEVGLISCWLPSCCLPVRQSWLCVWKPPRSLLAARAKPSEERKARQAAAAS